MSEPMRIYIAGPMRGRPEFNFPAFRAAAARLRALGFEVFNPAETDVQEDGFDPTGLTAEQAEKLVKPFAFYMQRDLPEVCRSQAVHLLEGWEDSTGAKLEVTVAVALGLLFCRHEASALVWVNPNEVVATLRDRWLAGRAFGGLVNQPVPKDMAEPPPAETILEEAARLTSQDRNKHYGHPRHNFNCTAALWTAYLRSTGKLTQEQCITPREFGWMMVFLKGARDGNLPKRDNLVDGSGYLRCIERLAEPV